MEETFAENRSQHVRPLEFGEILDMTFRLYKNRFVSIFAITLLLCGPFYFLNEVSTWVILIRSMEVVTEWDAIAIIALLILLLIVIMLFGIILMPLWFAAVTGISAGAFFRDESFTWIEGLKLAGKYGKKSILTCLLLFALGTAYPLIYFGSLFIFLLLIDKTGAADWVSLILIVFSFLFFIFFTLYLFIRFSLIFPVMTEEGLAYFSCLKRSWTLTKSSFWRIFGLLFILILLDSFITGIPSTINQALLSDPSFYSMGIAMAISLTITFFLCLTAPLKMITLVLIYADRRARREGLDLEMQMAQMESPA